MNSDVFHQILKDLAQGLDTVAVDFDRAVFGFEVKLQGYFIIAVVILKLKIARRFQLALLLLSPVYKEALNDPFYVPRVSLEALEPNTPFDLVLVLFSCEPKFPKFRQG